MREVININNNSTLKTLHLDLVENGLNYASGVNWEGLGRLIGTHPSLKQGNNYGVTTPP